MTVWTTYFVTTSPKGFKKSRAVSTFKMFGYEVELDPDATIKGKNLETKEIPAAYRTNASAQFVQNFAEDHQGAGIDKRSIYVRFPNE